MLLAFTSTFMISKVCFSSFIFLFSLSLRVRVRALKYNAQIHLDGYRHLSPYTPVHTHEDPHSPVSQPHSLSLSIGRMRERRSQVPATVRVQVAANPSRSSRSRAAPRTHSPSNRIGNFENTRPLSSQELKRRRFKIIIRG